MQGMGPPWTFLYILVFAIAFIVPPALDLVLMAASGIAFGLLFWTIYTNDETIQLRMAKKSGG